MKTSEKFEPGQVWKYAGRPGEEESTLTILKIEQYEKGGTIIHIRVDGIILFNPNTGRDNLTHIGHMPFAEEAISKSVTEIVGLNDNLPDFSQGYNQWKEAWDNGKAGCWTIGIKDAIQGMDSVIRK